MAREAVEFLSQKFACEFTRPLFGEGARWRGRRTTLEFDGCGSLTGKASEFIVGDVKVRVHVLGVVVIVECLEE